MTDEGPTNDDCIECGMPLIGGPCMMVTSTLAVCWQCATRSEDDDAHDCSDTCSDDGYDSDYEDQP